MQNYKIPTEYREKGKGVSRIKYFKRIYFLINWLSILHSPFDEYNDFRHFHLIIIAELFRGRSLLRNSTLIRVLLTDNFTIDVILRIF